MGGKETKKSKKKEASLKWFQGWIREGFDWSVTPQNGRECMMSRLDTSPYRYRWKNLVPLSRITSLGWYEVPTNRTSGLG